MVSLFGIEVFLFWNMISSGCSNTGIESERLVVVLFEYIAERVVILSGFLSLI